MKLDIVEVVKTIGAVMTALGAIFGLIFAIYRWYLRQNQQDNDIATIKEEQCVLTYGVLACLKGLEEKGCDGPVKDAIKKIEKHLNQQAHK